MNRREFLTMTGMGAVGAAFAKTPGENAGPMRTNVNRQNRFGDFLFPCADA